MRKLAAITLGLVVLHSQPVKAEPCTPSPIEDLIPLSALVVSGRIDNASSAFYDLEIEHVFKGTPNASEIRIYIATGYEKGLEKGSHVVMFLKPHLDGYWPTRGNKGDFCLTRVFHVKDNNVIDEFGRTLPLDEFEKRFFHK